MPDHSEKRRKSKATTTNRSCAELCDACKYDVRGLTACPECGRPTRKARRDALIKLREEWPSEQIQPRTPAVEETPSILLDSGDQMATDLLCQHLQARGIHSQVRRWETSSPSARVPSKAGYQLIVWTNDQERARAIIDHLWPLELREKRQRSNAPS